MLLPSLLLSLPCQSTGAEPAVGRVEYAIVVRDDNPAEALTGTELARILRAEVQEWPTRDSVRLLLPRSGTSEKRLLLERVYRMTDLQLKRYWTQLVYEHRIVEEPLSVPSVEVALRTLERTRGSLTIVPASALGGEKGLKILRIDAKRPGDPGYPLWLVPEPLARRELDPRARASEASASRAQEPADDPVDSDLLARVSALENAFFQHDDGLPALNWRLFGHMETEYEKETIQGGSTRAVNFSIEVLDLLVTAAIGERFSILTETVYEAKDDNDFDVEVERLLVKYRASDALNIQGGRFLTTLGFWNSRYHHGEWLQTSIDRPEILNFEDDDGLLPIHNVGLSFKGAFFGDELALDYTLELANGRGRTPDQTQSKLDANDVKAVNVSLGLEPSRLRGLRVGGGFYVDDIPPNADADAGGVHGELDETILNAYCAFEDKHWEAMAEYFRIEHEGQGVDADSSGWYLQLGHRFGTLTPYLRLDGAERDDLDPFWSSGDDTSTWVLGVRYDASRWLALTLQYERTDIDVPAGDPDERTDTIVLQATF